MASGSALRTVKPGEKPRRSRPRTVSQAAKDGDRRELLVAMRDRVAVKVSDPKTPAQALAALTKRLLEIVDEIDAIDAGERGDDIGAAAATPDEKWAAS